MCLWMITNLWVIYYTVTLENRWGGTEKKFNFASDVEFESEKKIDI